ncbi:MAG TPA: hypothetical protein VLF43_00085, partial [Candidatus Saccharimonadales bacterium]|nr:hypothetical protein [Candidatus Saccharimonadales bacterium]
HDDGTLTLSHYNYKGDGNYSVEQGTASASAFGLAVFIHFEDYLPASIVTGVTAEPVPPITEPEVAPAEVAPALAPAPDSPVIEEVPVEAVESQTTVTPSAEVVAPTPEVAPALVTAPASLPPVPAAMPVTPQPAPPPVPTTPIWQQAASSPPSVRLTDVKPLSTAVAVRTEPTPMYIATYWPLLGLVGALIAQGATTRRIKIVS